MSVDLHKRVIKQKAKRKVSRRTPKRPEKLQFKIQFPKKDPYKVFLTVPKEQMLDALNAYILSKPLPPKEVRAISILKSRIPASMVHKFFKFMDSRGFSSISRGVTAYLKQHDVAARRKQMNDFLKMRIPKPAKNRLVYDGFTGPPLKYTPRLPPSLGYFEKVRQNRENCIINFSSVPWASQVVNEPTVGVAILSRNTPKMSEWIGNEVRDGWFHVKDEWIKAVCYFDREWQPNTIGYLLESGRILLEDKRLYDASLAYFRQNKPVVKTNLCSTEYMRAPWVAPLIGPVISVRQILAKDVPEMRPWLKTKIKGDWYSIKSSWFDHVCENGRPWISGAIGYRLSSGKVMPETRELYLLSNSEKRVESLFHSTEILSECVSNTRRGSWTDLPGVVGMVAKDTKTTRKWIPEVRGKRIPIKDDWYPLKKSWYDHVCKYGRMSGAYGYRLSSGEIKPETPELYDKYLQSMGPKEAIERIPPNSNSYKAVNEILLEVLPSSFVKDLLPHLPNVNNYELAIKAALLYVMAGKLIKEPQVHRQRLKNNQYIPEVLVRLSKEEMLPEVYYNPNRDPNKDMVFNWAVMDSILQKKLDTIKNRILQGIENPRRIRKLAIPSGTKYPESGVYKCSEDPVYYYEEEKMFCFDREMVLDKSENPHTGNRFTDNFIWLVRNLKAPDKSDVDRIDPISPKEAESQESPTPIVRKRRSPMLAPNLFKKLKVTHRPKTSPLVYCAQCNKSVAAGSSFNTVFNQDVISFCNSACFEEFDFRKK
jgi:hypothetical protein